MAPRTLSCRFSAIIFANDGVNYTTVHLPAVSLLQVLRTSLGRIFWCIKSPENICVEEGYWMTQVSDLCLGRVGANGRVK